MVMTLLTRPKKTVATVVIATDGSGDFNCDGTADDVEIQAAIDSLPAGGGCIYMKEGTYNITASITINVDNVSIIGCGRSTQIRTTLNINLIYSAAIAKNVRILLENLYLYGSGAGAAAGIRFRFGTGNSIIENCWVENCGGYAIFFQTASTDNKITGNTLNLNGGGIIVESVSHRNIITSNNVDSNKQHGIYIHSTCDDNVVIGNVVTNNDVDNTATYDGIAISAGCDNNVIVGNRCQDNDRNEIHIFDVTCNKNVVVGNSCVGTDHVAAITDVGTGTIGFAPGVHNAT